MVRAVPADRCPLPSRCRKTARRAASLTSSSARTDTASPCAGAVMLTPTAWTALTRKTVALEVRVVLRRSSCLLCWSCPPPPPCPISLWGGRKACDGAAVCPCCGCGVGSSSAGAVQVGHRSRVLSNARSPLSAGASTTECMQFQWGGGVRHVRSPLRVPSCAGSRSGSTRTLPAHVRLPSCPVVSCSSHLPPGRVPVQQHAVQAPGLEVRWGGRLWG